MAIVIGHLGPRFVEDPRRRQRRPRPPPEPQTAPLPPEAVLESSAGGSSTRAEHLRAEIASLNLALQQAETASALTQRVAEGLAEVETHLAKLSSLVTLARSEGAGKALEDRTREIGAVLRKLENAAARTRFGDRALLDGSLSPLAEARGEGLQFVAASSRTRASPTGGFPVVVRTFPARARLEGERPVTPELLRKPIRLGVRAGDRWAEAATRGGESFAGLCAALALAIREGGLELRVVESAGRRLAVEHVRYGPGRRFWADSFPAGILSMADGSSRIAEDGRDVAGTLNSEPARGQGESLAGVPGNRTTDGLVVAWTGPPPPEDEIVPGEGARVGSVVILSRGLNLRFGGAESQGVRVQAPSVLPSALGRNVFNQSGFANLAEIRVGTTRQTQDALRIVERAQAEVYQARLAVLQVLSACVLPRVNELRAQMGQAAPESAGDARWAGHLAALVSEQMEDDQSLARQAQLHPPPGAVMKLIN